MKVVATISNKHSSVDLVEQSGRIVFCDELHLPWDERTTYENLDEVEADLLPGNTLSRRQQSEPSDSCSSDGK